MLIRSQDKDCVVSMEKISAICINKMSHCIPSRCTIDAEYANETVLLGLYESEDRAKAVLHDIILYESLMKAIEFRVDAADVDVTAFEDMLFGCYDMPAE